MTQVNILSNIELKSVNSCKDLGVHVSRNLSWSNHVNAVVNKANKVVSLLKRTVGSKNREIFSMLYKSLVRPILEYACPVWSPYLVKDKLAIEKVQRRASRIALGQKLCKMSYEERCILLNWNTLQHRREYLSVVECYQTVCQVIKNGDWRGLNHSLQSQGSGCGSVLAGTLVNLVACFHSQLDEAHRWDCMVLVTAP